VGATNVKAVYAWWSHLADQPFRLLAYMALTAKDDDSPPRFWGGRESLAIGIGRTPPHTETDFRAVGRAMGKLRSAGAVELEQHSSPGRRANYVIRLQPGTQDTERPLNTGQLVTGTPDTNRSEQVSLTDGTPDTDRPPKDIQEPQGLTEGTTTHPVAQPQGDAREHCSCGHNRFAADGECLNCRRPRAA
jgi:hypothetical protein